MRFESLKVYGRSYDLALSVYRLSEGLSDDERYGIVSQLKRASLSIPLNIAEGYGKQSSKAEYNRFLAMAKGSCSEVVVLLSFLKDIGKLKEEHYIKYRHHYEEVERMLYAMINSNKQ